MPHIAAPANLLIDTDVYIHDRDRITPAYGPLLGTQEIRFGRKTNEIAKFSILDEKTKFTILDEIWTKNGQIIAKKVVKSFHIHWHYHNALTVGLKERMTRIIGMRMD